MGGNVFSPAKPIKKENIDPTLSFYFEELIRLFPRQRRVFENYSLVGSAGQKEVSGDIDLAIDASLVISDFPVTAWNISPDDVQRQFNVLKRRARTATDDMLMMKATLIEIGRYINRYSIIIEVDVTKITHSSMFTLCPQFDLEQKSLETDVQIDWMVGDPEWLKFSYYSESYSEPTIKGLHRTQLIVALFHTFGYYFHHGRGIKSHQSGKWVATTPEKAIALISLLIGEHIPKYILANYTLLHITLRHDLSEECYSRLITTYLRILDRTRADIPVDLRDVWISRQDELGLTGKFLPEDSNLRQYLEQESLSLSEV